MLLGGDGDGDKVEKNKLSNSQIADNIIGVIFAAQDTTASVLTWILKYLHDDHHLLGAVKVKKPICVGVRGSPRSANLDNNHGFIRKDHLHWYETLSYLSSFREALYLK